MIDRRRLCLGAVLALIAGPGLASDVAPISPKARRLLALFDSLDVEHKWPAGVHVNWETGVPDGGPVSAVGKHTHCSAFAGSVAAKLGIALLRPPEHGQTLLANAQLEWLETTGAANGWQSLPDAVAAQNAANAGQFVVASYRNHDPKRPGHIAIVRAAIKSIDAINMDGPDIIQAGGHNYTDTTVRIGFAGHPLAWLRGKEIRFFAHDWDGKIHFSGEMQF